MNMKICSLETGLGLIWMRDLFYSGGKVSMIHNFDVSVVNIIQVVRPLKLLLLAMLCWDFYFV